ncbi:hypothetical protein AB0G79_11475 [Streptomyces sp. NPDC020807]|uniref:hypothetical protein n=1 Tax=Streptomyces sp. NPDC020807 TaxID=3155119 RepID=UPI0033CE5FD6
MKPRTVLTAVALATMPLILTTPAQATTPEPSQGVGGPNTISDVLKPGTDKDTRNGGPAGPGLSGLVEIAEGILSSDGK